jgi:hypothetical protein
LDLAIEGEPGWDRLPVLGNRIRASLRGRHTWYDALCTAFTKHEMIMQEIFTDAWRINADYRLLVLEHQALRLVEPRLPKLDMRKIDARANLVVRCEPRKQWKVKIPSFAFEMCVPRHFSCSITHA